VEPSGGNRWQPVANGSAPKAAPMSENRCGKEGVDGSSPSEGFENSLLISSFRSLLRRHEQGATSTERPRAGESPSSAAVIR
jgi:hypothetical protein